MSLLGKSLAWAFVVVCGLVMAWQSINLARIHFFPPDIAYFESDLSRRLANDPAMAGRDMKCTVNARTDLGYEVDCQYFREGVGEERTHHLFGLNGDYVGTLNGG